MATIISRAEMMRRAVRFISEERSAHPRAAMSRILDEAGLRFDLSPLEEESLRQLLSLPRRPS
jgi:hypothetical protein